MAESTWQIEEYLKCLVCQDTLNEPRNLHCGHTFCKTCIDKWYRQSVNNIQSGRTVANCPTCRKPFSFDKDGVAGLPINHHLSDLVEVFKAKPDSSVSHICEMCKSVPPNPAVYACIDCKLNMCEGCKNSHEKFRGASAHTVTDLSEKSVKWITMRRKKSYCRQHTHESHELEYYCKDCNIPICMKCSLVTHKRHRREELWKYARESRTFIEQISQETEKKHKQYFRLLEDINYERDSVQYDKDENIEKIRSLTAELIDAIKQTEASQVACISSSIESKMDQLRKKQEECETEMALIDSFNLFAHSLCKFGSDANVVLQGEYVKTQSEKICRNAVNFRFEQNVPKYCISDRFFELFRQIKNEDFLVCKLNKYRRDSDLQTTTSVDSEDHQNSYTDAISTTCAISNQLKKADFHNADSTNVPYENVDNAFLESKHDDEDRTRNLEQTDEKHGQEIFATTLIREFDICAKVNITGLTVTENHEVVVVTNIPGSIIIYSQDGKQICKLRCSGFENPFDAATGRHGIVYITDTGTREYGIKVLQKKGRKYELSTFLREPDNPHGIAFHSDHLYVCDATALSFSIYSTANKRRVRIIEAKVQGPIFSCPIYITALESHVVLISDYKDKNVYRISTGSEISTDIVFNENAALSEGFRPAKTSASADKYFITDMTSGEIFVFDNISGKTYRLNFSRYGVMPNAIYTPSPESVWIGTKEGKIIHLLLKKCKNLSS